MCTAFPSNAKMSFSKARTAIASGGLRQALTMASQYAHVVLRGRARQRQDPARSQSNQNAFCRQVPLMAATVAVILSSSRDHVVLFAARSLYHQELVRTELRECRLDVE